MDYVLTIDTGTTLTERRFASAADLRSMEKQLKSLMPGAQFHESTRAPLKQPKNKKKRSSS